MSNRDLFWVWAICQSALTLLWFVAEVHLYCDYIPPGSTFDSPANDINPYTSGTLISFSYMMGPWFYAGFVKITKYLWNSGK